MKKLFLISILATLCMAEVVPVTKSTPITKEAKKKILVDDGRYTERVSYQVPCDDVDKNSLGVDTLVGVAGGAVLGSQIGKGNGRVAAQIIGGLMGGHVANNMRSSNNTCTEYRTVTKYNPTYEWETEIITIGYNNCAYYDGQEYCKKSRQPLKTLRIEKIVRVY